MNEERFNNWTDVDNMKDHIRILEQRVDFMREKLEMMDKQEPVAFWNFNSGFSHCMIDQLNEAAKKNPAPLYTSPPQRTEQEPVAHWSDCAVHSEPAYPKGECDCGGIVAVADYTALSDKYVALSDKYVALKAQRTWVGLTEEDKKQMFKEANYHWEMTAGEYAERIGQLTEAKLKERNT